MENRNAAKRPPGHPAYRHPTIVNIKTTTIHDALYTQFRNRYYKIWTVEVFQYSPER